MVSTSFMVDTSSHPRAQLHRCVEKSAYQRAGHGPRADAARKARACGAPLRGLRGVTSSASPEVSPAIVECRVVPTALDRGIAGRVFRFPFPHDPIGAASGNGST